MTQHGVELLQAIAHQFHFLERTAGLIGQFAHRLQLVGYKLVQGGIEQANGHLIAVHGREDAFEVTTLQWQQLGQGHAARVHIRGDNHLAHCLDAVALKEHVLGAAQTDAVGTQLTSLHGIARRVGVGVHVHLAVFLGQIHHCGIVASQVGIDGGNGAIIHLAGAAVDRNPSAFLIGLTVHLDGASLVVNLDGSGTRHTALAHTTSNDGCVRCHATTGGQDTLSHAHAAQVLGRGLDAHHDYFLLALGPLLGIVGKEHDLAGSGTRAGRKTLGHDVSLLDGGLVKHGVQQLIEFARLHALDHGLLVNHTLAQQVHGNLDHSGTSALAIAGLEQPQLAVLDGELQVLHIVIVVLQFLLDLNQLSGALGHRLLKRGILRGTIFFADTLQGGPAAAALDGDLLGCAHTSHDILTLGVDQIFAVEDVLAGSGIACECNAGGTGVAHVAIDHSLHVDGSAIVRRDAVHLAVEDSALVVPTVKHSVDSAPQLLPSIGREVLASAGLHSSLEADNQLLEVVNIEFGVKFHTLLLLDFLDDHLKRVLILLALGLHAQHNVAIHLHKATVAVPSKAGITRLLGQSLGHSIIDAQVQHCVHHAGHRHGSTRANRHQLRIAGVVKLISGQALDVLDSLLDIVLNQVDNCLTALLVIQPAHVGGDGETRGNRHANQVHLGQIGTLAAQKISHVGTAFCLAVTESVDCLHKKL